MKLRTEFLSNYSANVLVPGYDRSAVRHGIVHIGVGGFHRAHQAVYTENLLNQDGDLDWGICGVGLRPEDEKMKDALASQDYLYTVCELSDAGGGVVQVIGSIGDFWLAEESPKALIEKLASPAVRIVSLTITEGGYCTDDSTGQFIADLPEIIHDLENPQSPKTVFGFLAQSLALRNERDIKPFTVMSCDNLAHNGDVARRALLAFVGLFDADLRDWIAGNVSFPNSMVDRITPMTSDEHRRQLLAQYSIDDLWPVVCEPFSQWVLEDNFCNGRPQWENVGVQFTDNVASYERMKIALLNGSHFAMAYLGLLMGYEFAHEAMQDPMLQRYVLAFMDEDVSSLLDEVPGIDLNEYKAALIDRFSNKAIRDQLFRIGSDGSSKFPKFILPTLLGLIEQGKSLDRISLFIAAWAHYLKQVEACSILDPRVDYLQQAVSDETRLTQKFLGLDDVFGQVVPKNAAFVEAFNMQLERLQNEGAKVALALTLDANYRLT